LAAKDVGVAIGCGNQFDWIARSDSAAPDHPSHLTRATHHRLKRINVDFEHFAAHRPIAGDFELGVADLEPRTRR
jgi:hypothetical protein